MNTETTSGLAELPLHPEVEWVWPMTFVIALIALWIPWYLRALDLDIGRIAWILTVASAAHILSAPVLARLPNGPSRDVALLAMHAVSLFALGFVWILLGAMDAPLFVIFFAPPILAASAIRGVWRRALASGLALAVPLLAAMVASPSLRWYVTQVGLPLGFLDAVAVRLASLGAPSEQSIAPTTAATSLGLATAALVTLYACASGFATASRGTIEWLHRSLAALRRDKGLALELLQSSPLPEALVLPESARVVLVNDRFRAAFASHEHPVEGARLSELVKLQFPEALERLVQSGDGTVEGRCPGSDGQLREIRLHVRRSKHQDAHVARVSFEDRTAERRLESVLDTMELVILVLDANGGLVFANSAAQVLFPESKPGAAASAVLRHPDLPDRWWRTPEETSIPRELSIAGSEYRGKVFCRRPGGLAEPFTVIALAAVGRR